MSDVDCGDGGIAGGRGREEVGEVVVGVDNDGEVGGKRGEGELERAEVDRGELDRDEVDRGERCMSTCPGPTQLSLSSST
jgi:hypothetical protein